MPVYEFQCTCGHIFEDMVALSRRDLLTECPKCNKQTAHRTARIYGPYGHISGSHLAKEIKNTNN